MVHALQLAHSLLSPGAVLVDIHPTGQPSVIEINVGGVRRRLGEMQETDDFIEYFQADEALVQVMHSGLFTRTRRAEFIFLDHAASLEELRSYLLDNWSDAVWPDEVTRRANEISPPGQSAEIPATLVEYVSISRLQKLSPHLDESPSR